MSWKDDWHSVFEQRCPPERAAKGRIAAALKQVIFQGVVEGQARARVVGAATRPYNVRIWCKPIDGRSRTRIARMLQASSSGEGPGIEAVLEEIRPQRPSELNAECTCSDWAPFCSHSAAVFYMLLEESTKNPDLLLALRGVSAEDVPKTVYVAPDLSDFWKSTPLPESFDVGLHDEPTDILSTLGPLSWCSRDEARETLGPIWTSIGATAREFVARAERARQEAEVLAVQQAEENAKRAALEEERAARKKAEEEARRAAEEAARKIEEARREAEARRREQLAAEEARRRAAEEARAERAAARAKEMEKQVRKAQRDAEKAAAKQAAQQQQKRRGRPPAAPKIAPASVTPPLAGTRGKGAPAPSAEGPRLSSAQKKALRAARKVPLSEIVYCVYTDTDIPTARRELDELCHAGLLRRRGRGEAARYVLAEQG